MKETGLYLREVVTRVALGLLESSESSVPLL